MAFTRSAALCVVVLLATPQARAVDCPGSSTPSPHLLREQIQRTLSANAEDVAPSPSTGGKRRSIGVAPPRVITKLPVANYIDSYIAAKLSAERISPAELAGDEEFLRRITLDLTGTIPAAAEVTAFVADTAADKRARKIDALLQSEAFADRWTMWLGDLVENVQRAAGVGRVNPRGPNAFYLWMRDSFRADKPYDQMVREMLSAQGKAFSDGPANYILRHISSEGPPQDTRDNLATNSAEKFLGMPLLCISCHDGARHLELTNWYLRGKTRYDFYQTAAFFSKTVIGGVPFTDPETGQTTSQGFTGPYPNGLYMLDTTEGNKSPRVPAPGQSPRVDPAFFMTGERPREGELYQAAYARMLTAERQFARTFANHLWKEMFGLALIEPVNMIDPARLDSQTIHPELLEALTDDVIAKNFSFREVLRSIALSNTYQLSMRYTPGNWNESMVPYYARRYPRRIHAEMLFDAISTATGIAPTFPITGGLPPVTKAMQLPDPYQGGRSTPNGLFLDALGRPNRDDIFRTSEPGILQALRLMNDPVVTARVKQSAAGSTVARVLAATTDPGAIVDELYLTTLSRKPTAVERQIAIEHLRGGPLAVRTEDLQLVLLNTLEFLFQ